MENYIIIGIVIVVGFAAIRSIIKRSGRKGCCGSSDYKPRKKKLKNMIATKTFVVDGMHCEKCADRVTEIVNDFPGIAGTVDLKKGIVTISYEFDVPDEQIKAKLERVGYTVSDIQ